MRRTSRWPLDLANWSEAIAFLRDASSSGIGDASARRLPEWFDNARDRPLWLELWAACSAGGRLELYPASRLGPPAAGAAGARPNPIAAQRLAWWPDGQGCERRVAVASSRLPKALDTLPELFRTLRAAVRDAVERQERVTIVEGTAAARLVARAARRARALALHVQIASERSTLHQWLRTAMRQVEPTDGPSSLRLFLSPPLTGHVTPPGSFDRFPIGDIVLALLADRLDVAYVRRGGTWDALLRLLLADASAASPSIRLATNRQLAPPALARKLVEAGAIDWQPPEPRCGTGEPSTRTSRPACDSPVLGRHSAATFPVPSPEAPMASVCDDLLVHFTRRREGPWLGQTWDEFLDELFDEDPSRDRSALAVLLRILQEGRIRGANAAIRGGYPVACFSAVPLAGLSERRVWRRHRRRWDFEPYGLAIRRTVLAALGARPVIYGDESTWNSLSAADRPFFQQRYSGVRDWHARHATRPPSTSEPGGTPTLVDWSDEQEWRWLGDLALTPAILAATWVLTPDEAAAQTVARQFALPIVILSESR